MKCYVCQHSFKLPSKKCLEGGSLDLLVNCPPASKFNIRYNRCFIGFTNGTSKSFYNFERKCGRMIPYHLGCSRNLVSKFDSICACAGEGCNGDSFLPAPEVPSDSFRPFFTNVLLLLVSVNVVNQIFKCFDLF